ncbi:hypothetical protein BH10ACT2_BH10ACT2_16450 [soil metagenome]
MTGRVTGGMTKAKLQPAIFVAGVVAVGVALRAWVISSSLGAFNGDEAFAGLQSISVLRDGHLPVVINGQTYTAAIDAILFSPFLTLAGGSSTILKWLFVCMWAAAAAATFGAMSRLRDRRSAALAAAIVWLTPGALLVLSTTAYMGYAIGMTVVACTVWATAVVADQEVATVRQSAILGALAGLAFYIHPMFATVVVPVVAVAAFVHRRDWRRWWLPAAIAALVVNLPFLAWNAINDWPSLKSQAVPPGSYTDRFRGFISELLPRAFGLRKFDGGWVLARPVALLIYAAIVAGVVYGCVVLVRAHQRPSRWIVPAGLAACLPLMALAPHLIFINDGRYAIIPFPFFAFALSAAATSLIPTWSRQRTMAAFAGALALWVAITTLPFLNRQHAALADDPNAWQERVIDRLDELGIDRLAGYYWFVMPIEYRSDREIRVAIAGNPYKIRFVQSQQIVESTPPEKVAFIFPPGEPDPNWLYLPIDSYRREDLGGMILFVPIAAGS